MSDQRVLVVGTTPDYVAYIHKRYPGRAIFLTDPALRVGSTEVAPDHSSEVVCRLDNYEDVLNTLGKHLQKTAQSLSGVACYDCEWLSLAAELAQHFDLPFPCVQSVRLTRDKYRTKKKWAEHGIRCPGVELIHTERQLPGLIDRLGRSVVLKPTTGAGSELTFQCHNDDELTTAFSAITAGLAERGHLPLYRLDPTGVARNTLDHPVLAEEFIEGHEYSADFMFDGDELELVRVAKKLSDDALPFGTTLAYVVPAELPEWMGRDTLRERLLEAVQALGLKRAICMVDFIVRENELVLLELTPRIGGDCLPPLIRHSCGLDTIRLALDFAEGRKCEIPPAHKWKEHIGLRLLATSSGLLTAVDRRGLSGDSAVKETLIKRAPGHKITIPPEDYESWLLGHVIFSPRTDINLHRQCDDIKQKIIIHLEQYHDQGLAEYHNASRRAAPSPGPRA